MLRSTRLRSVSNRIRPIGISAVLNSIPVAPAGADNAFLAHPSYWASDASHLVPCAAGDAIRWWKDAVTGTWYEQPTSGLRHIARQDATGKWYAENDGTKLHQWVDLTGLPLANITLAAAFRKYSNTTGSQILSSFGGATYNCREFRSLVTTGQINTRINTPSGSSISDPVGININTDYRYTATLAAGGANSILYRNGISAISSSDISVGNFDAGFFAGGIYSGSNCMNGRIYGLLIAKNIGINVATWDAALHGYCTS